MRGPFEDPGEVRGDSDFLIITKDLSFLLLWPGVCSTKLSFK